MLVFFFFSVLFVGFVNFLFVFLFISFLFSCFLIMFGGLHVNFSFAFYF
jgi:hypothetical protein